MLESPHQSPYALAQKLHQLKAKGVFRANNSMENGIRVSKIAL